MNTIMPLLKFTSNGSTKEKIISVLSEKWPLTSKQLHSLLVRGYSLDSTYQGVHKALAELTEQGILCKDNGKYSLDKKWIENITKFGASTHKRYFEENIDIKKILREESFNLNFKIPMEFGRFVLELIKELKQKPSIPIVFKWFHAWPLVGFSDEEMKELKRLFTSGPLYIAYKHETPVDKITLEAFADFGAKMVKKNLLLNQDVMVIGDYVFHVHLDAKKELEWHKMCLKTSKSNKFNLLQQLFKISEDNFPIHVLGGKSPELAKSILDEFRRKK